MKTKLNHPTAEHDYREYLKVFAGILEGLGIVDHDTAYTLVNSHRVSLCDPIYWPQLTQLAKQQTKDKTV